MNKKMPNVNFVIGRKVDFTIDPEGNFTTKSFQVYRELYQEIYRELDDKLPLTNGDHNKKLIKEVIRSIVRDYVIDGRIFPTTPLT